MPLTKGGYYDFVTDADWPTFEYYGATSEGHTNLGVHYYALADHAVPAKYAENEEYLAAYEAFWADEAPYLLHPATYNWSGKYDIGQ